MAHAAQDWSWYESWVLKLLHSLGYVLQQPRSLDALAREGRVARAKVQVLGGFGKLLGSVCSLLG